MIESSAGKKRNFPGKALRLAVLASLLVSLVACASLPSTPGARKAAELPSVEKMASDFSQLLLVKEESFFFLHSRKIYALEKTDSGWRQAMEPMDAVIGRNGFAPAGEKREGDGRTPSGLYALGLVFGYAQTVPTKMPYRQALADDVWVDDPDAPDYNRWVRKSETRARSYEMMRREDDLYQYGIVIEYNTQPVVRNYGSAIFLHIRAGAGTQTAGCVAVSGEDMMKILAWLDPQARPVILLNPDP